MTVAAVLLATVVASSLGGGPPPGDPRTSFTFDAENDTVLVRHYGGDAIDGSALVVESGERGRLGTFDGSDGMACEHNVTTASVGSVCRVPNATHERLFVVWENRNNRSLILARRAPDPTPTLVPTTMSPTATPSPTVAPGTTAEPTVATPTASPVAGTTTATASPVPTPTGTPTPSPAPVSTPTPTATPEPNSVPTTAPTPTNATAGGG
jgi:hypothetical protein